MISKCEVDNDDVPVERDFINTAFYKILDNRISRRKLVGVSGLMGACFALDTVVGTVNSATKTFTSSFEELAHGLDEQLHVAKGYSYDVIVKWGDPVFKDAPTFNPHHQSPDSQAKQFGYNNDFVAYLPLRQSNKLSEQGLLIVNHEYVNSSLMHPGSPDAFYLSKLQTDTEIQAHGVSIIEIQKQTRKWHTDTNSKLNRRITPYTEMHLSGPASGHERMKTSYSPDGEMCVGTIGNCAGSITPWGTVLTAEENVQAYFMGDSKHTSEYKSYKRFGLLGDETAYSAWGKFHDRWNINKHPNIGLHYGWIVEIDPYDPSFTPIKRTALGRCKHEGCGVHINKDKRVVVYMGDDQAFEYVYRFVSKKQFIVGDRAHNLSLLDEGELSVAEFTDQGHVEWHPLIWGKEPYTQGNGFNSQADVVIDTRNAADLVGATPMDRPEEIKVNPITSNVFVVLTNNFSRYPLQTNASNPRALNRHGHILELIPPDQDHSAHEYRWEIFLLAGNPDKKLDRAYYHAEITENGWFSSPDNCSFDNKGNLWIATDGFYRFGRADGIWMSSTNANQKALCKHFLRAPREAEICSPCFTPDHKTMFCSVQHPGGNSTFDQPSTRWPDFDLDVPPRPAVIAVSHNQDEEIGK